MVIARLYDPLGLIGPVIAKAKIFLQKLWIQRLNWDDVLPEEISTDWQCFVSELKDIENLRIPHWILIDNVLRTVLHCFTDASEIVFGAAVYMQNVTQFNTANARLISSKSRVVPLKTISISRLELSTSLLAVQLVQRVKQSLKINPIEVILYIDFTIGLAWIKILTTLT